MAGFAGEETTIHFLKTASMSATDLQISRRWPAIATVVGGLAVALMIYGCRTRHESIVTLPETDARDACSSLLASGLDMARPQSLGLIGIDETLRSSPEEAAKQFEQWLRRDDCRIASPSESISAESRELLERLLGPDGASGVLSEQVDAFDAAHVRNALLDYAAAQSCVREDEADLDRVLRIFNAVVRTITPSISESSELPLTSYEARLFGRGTAETRAWAFASLLRQLRTDAVILRPAAGPSADEPAAGESAAGDGGGPWWVGVLTDDGIYLFDTELGLPVPDGSGALTSDRLQPMPATWSSVVENPKLLVEYRTTAGLDAPAIDPQQLAPPRVELIGPRSFWSTAMERMELSMTGDRGVLLYDPLHKTQAGTGLFDRVVRAGGDAWNAEAISVWDYPERVKAARQTMSASQRQRLEQRLQPFLGPVEPDARDGEIGPHRRLWETRVDHLSGRAGAVIGVYLRMKDTSGAHPMLTEADRSLNALVSDEAQYWWAHAQFDDGEYAAAAKTIEIYLSQNGDRSEEASVLRILALAASGRVDEARTAVGELPETTPGLPRLKWLAVNWASDSAAD